MRWWLRQVAVLAADRDETTERIARAFGLEVCHRNDEIREFAMSNSLCAVGSQFLEIATPLDGGSPAGRRLETRGEGGYLVILQTNDIDEARQRAEAAGAAVTIELEHPGARELHLHPKSTAGVALALDWMDPPESWKWAGPDWERAVRADVVLGLAGLTISADEPQSIATRWAEILGTDIEAGPDASTIWLEEGWLRFARRVGGPPALSRLHLTPADPSITDSVWVGACEITTLPGGGPSPRPAQT